MTQFVPPRIPFVDPQTGIIAKAWEDFLRDLFSVTNGVAAGIAHNDLVSIQGGSVGSYYHFTSGEHAALVFGFTGTGLLARQTSPVFITPDLGTPSACVGTNLSGTAAALTSGAVTVADSGGDTTTWVMLAPSQTGSTAPVTDDGLTYDASTNTLTATTFVGALTGTASGNIPANSWASFTTTRTGWTDVGTPTVTSRYVVVGNVCFFQVKVVPATTVATVAGTSYVSLPVTAGASSIGGDGSMENITTLIATGACAFDVANSRCYVPTQGATGNTLTIAGWYEV